MRCVLDAVDEQVALNAVKVRRALPERWTSEMLAIARDFLNQGQARSIHHGTISANKPLRIDVWLVGKMFYWWTVRDGQALVAAGSLVQSDGRLFSIDRSAVTRSWQGQGIYPEVLRQLAVMLGGIESDSEQTPKASLVWRKLGAVEVVGRHGDPVYRLLP